MTTAPDQQLKRMKLRYAGTCRTCATPLSAGTLALYDRASRLVTCLACLQAPADHGIVGHRRDVMLPADANRAKAARPVHLERRTDAGGVVQLVSG
jgi:hypothetical protein